MLELGCASGANILPMAQGLPGSEFVGIDLSEHQVEEGQKTIRELGFKNITLRQANILDIDESFGKFDYIIAHGVYSWVPPEVRGKILEICNRNMTPDGVAYVSYNTYPGWNMIKSLREMMLYHTRGIEEPRQRAAEAIAFLEFLTKSVSGNNTPHGNFLNTYIKFYKAEIRHTHLGNEAILTHDELSEINDPVYFHQFIEHAEQYGLQYVADANFQTMLANNLPQNTAASLQQMVHSTIELEQYLDFLRNRTFRQTLLCHDYIQLSGAPKPECITNFHIGSPASPESPDIDIQSASVEKFRINNATFSTNHPITKAAMLYLTQIWPYVVPFDQLVSKAYTMLGRSVPDTNKEFLTEDMRVLGASLLKAYGYDDGLVELHVHAPTFTLKVSDRPVANRISRMQAQRGEIITNMRHERVNLDDISYHLLPYLDGQCDYNSLINTLQKLTLQGIIPIQEDSGKDADANVERIEKWETLLKSRLQRLANVALLVG
ncbi:MAG: class I SAM-dependent methyltransferase [Anaerolineae bacterium]|nr:class I SAM-dependent methyltransferase [Anaerolineae bacterium]